MRLLVVLLAALLAIAAPAAAAPDQDSTFQDDDELIYSPPAEVAATLDELKALGVDRLRVSVFWAIVAPQPEAEERPAFDATDPGAYPPGAWDRYDTVVRLAAERGLRVNFDLTGPSPDWATGEPARADLDPTFEPDPQAFGQFVRAVGRRYPQVTDWAIWNEPNQAGWLTPQWVRSGDAWVEAAPRRYRDLVDAAYAALVETGHGDERILVGETASKGLRDRRGETASIDALRFVRRLYCLDDDLALLTGAAAAAQGCPTTAAERAAFADRHPGLFRLSGWAHHPYEPLLPPNSRPFWRDWAAMGNLGDLSRVLRVALQRHGRPGPVPLYLTEFGYQTNPPDARSGVSPARQAAYLNHAEFLAYSNRSVRTFTQFLLVDSGEPVDRTFQTGLTYRDGRRKPAYAAYRLPIHLPRTTVARGRALRVWGLVRAAPDGGPAPRVQVQHRAPGGGWRRLATRPASVGRGYLDTRVRVPRSGRLRLVWDGTASRSVAVRVTGARRGR